MRTYKGAHSGLTYVPEAELGCGGFARVHACRRSDGQRFAVKQLMDAPPPGYRERFDGEMALLEALRRADHERDGVVAFEEPMRDDAAFAMELIEEGSDLEAWARRHLYPLSPRERLRAFGELAVRLLDLLVELHTKGIIHRDLKPANLLVQGDLADYSLRLIDFGIGKRLGVTPVAPTVGTAMYTRMGTAGYCAPEQLHDAARADVPADIYGAAVVLAETFLGAHPFGLTAAERDGDDALRAWQRRAEQVPDLGELTFLCPSLAHALEQALEPEPERRPRSVRELRQLVRAALDESAAAAWIEPAACGGVIVAWQPPRHGGRAVHRPVRLGPSDCPRLAVTPRADGILVESAAPRRLRVEAALRPPGGTVHVVGPKLLPWFYETPGAWHDVIPEEGDGAAVRVTRPSQRRTLGVRLHLLPGRVRPTVEGLEIQPTARGVRFFAVAVGTRVYVEEVPAQAWDTRVRLGDAGGFELVDGRALVLWDVESEPGFVGAFHLDANGVPGFVRHLRPDHQGQIEQAIHARLGTGPRRSNWPWPARVHERVAALAAELHKEEPLRPCAELLNPDARTWLAASRVLSLYDERVGPPLSPAAWKEVFATAALHAHDEREVLLYPHNPTPRRAAAGGPTRMQLGTTEPGRLANRAEVVDSAGRIRTAKDVYEAEQKRMSGANRPVIELAWVTAAQVPGVHVALHGPDLLRIGRWDRWAPPDVALFVSDRVSRTCASVALLEERIDVQALAPYVEAAGDTVKVYDPAFQRACPRCGARWDSLAPQCVDALLGTRHGPTAHVPLVSKLLRMAATTHEGIGNGGWVERIGRTVRAYVATHCFDVAPGVTVRAEDGDNVFVHVQRPTVKISGAAVSVGRTQKLAPGDTIEVPALGLEVRAFAPQPS